MDYCSAHFGKELANLNYHDIVTYFSTEHIETNQLEFKSVAGNFIDNYPGLIKTICGFVNSGGGILIWGAPQGVRVNGRDEKIFLGDPTPINQILSKDQIISRISDSIVPLPNKIRLQIIENDAGGCVCVFEIDESDYSPHQYLGTYYMRIDGQTKTAPHHYIEALFRKIKYPDLEGFLKFTGGSAQGNSYLINFEIYFFNWSPLQNVEDLSFRVVCDYGVFRNSQNPIASNQYAMNGHEYRRLSYQSVVHYGQPTRDANSVTVNSNKIAQNSNILYFMLAFGGKNTPSKSSEYRLDLSDIFVTPAERMVSERKENQLFKDVQDRLGATRQSIIQTVLER
jgi:hypothetical protein